MSALNTDALRRRTRVKIILVVFAICAAAVVAATLLELRINWTESMPMGLYRRVEPVLERGRWVAVCLEGEVATLARERSYVIDGSCPSGLTAVLKQLVAIPSDRVDLAAGGIEVNGTPIASTALRDVDSQGRDLRHAEFGARVLRANEFWVMGTNAPRSWDSRYFGPVRAEQIIGGAQPLWTFE